MKIMVNLLAQRSRATGTSRYALNLLRALLDTAGEDEEYVALITPENESFFRPLGPAGARTEVRPVESSSPWKRILYERTVLPRLASSLGADIMFTPYVSIAPAVRCKKVTTIHDLIALDHRYPGGPLRQVYLHRVIRRAARLSDAVLTVSRTSAGEISTRLGVSPDKIFLTPNAVDNTLRGQAESDGEGAGGRYFLYVGNTDPVKNIESLLRAFNLFGEGGKQRAELVLAGPVGPGAERLQRLASDMGMGETVKLSGHLDENELAGLYRDALALVIPSRQEGFGLPCLEAMAFGCPVLCSDIPVFRELYGDAAAFFAPEDPAGLAELMDRVASDDELKIKMADDGHAVSGRFSWKNSAEGARAAFQYVLGAGS
jgi:glycosyltransferase involved in cell wall biosynthesis